MFQVTDIFSTYMRVHISASLTYTSMCFSYLPLVPSAWIHSERHAVRHKPRSTH